MYRTLSGNLRLWSVILNESSIRLYDTKSDTMKKEWNIKVCFTTFYKFSVTEKREMYFFNSRMQYATIPDVKHLVNDLKEMAKVNGEDDCIAVYAKAGLIEEVFKNILTIFEKTSIELIDFSKDEIMGYSDEYLLIFSNYNNSIFIEPAFNKRISNDCTKENLIHPDSAFVYVCADECNSVIKDYLAERDIHTLLFNLEKNIVEE